MTPKERVQAFYNHQIPDELPTDDGLFVLFDPNAFQERPPYIQTGIDWFGVKWKRDETIGAIAPDHTQPPILGDISDWRDVVVFPDLEAWDWSRVEELDHVSEIDRENKVFNMMFLNGPFERLHMLMGFEDALCALITDPEEVEAFFEAFMEWKLRLMDKVAQYYKPDVLMFHDDWGTQKGMFFSPETWRVLIKPQIQKAVDRCHELGMIYEHHSCGKIEAVVPEFVEMGIDSWQGQDINDISKLKELTKGKLAFHTTPRYQEFEANSLAGVLTEDEVRSKVRANILENAEGGNYFPMPLPWGGWWLPIMMDEIKKVGKDVYKK